MRRLRWWAIAGAALVLLAFGVAEQSGAYWRAESTISGDIIRSGTLALRVGGASSQVSNYVFDAFGGTDLAPTAVVQKPLTVRNGGDVTMYYRLQTVRQSSAALPLTLQIWLVGAESGCPAHRPGRRRSRRARAPCGACAAPSARPPFRIPPRP